jgi:ferrous iron transport protein B
VGKSVIFNSLTGSRQHVGNWPGKTIELAEGIFYHGDWEIHLVDLPGTYSLAAQSPEEIVARDYILSGEPDVVVNVVDATSLERNLNLTLKILELTDRVVAALNLMDEIRRQGWEIDAEALETALGMPVVSTVATENKGLPQLAAALVEVADGHQQTHPASVEYGLTVEGHAQNLESDLARVGIYGRTRWVALRLLEDDPEIVKAFKTENLSAKEIVVSSLAMTYGLQTTLADSQDILVYLGQTWTSLVAFSFLTFYMLYLPCLVTVWATWKESLSVKWTLVSLLVSLLMAGAITVLLYQGGRLLGLSLYHGISVIFPISKLW